MKVGDPNLATLELVAHALGTLIDELVLVGGCSVGLLLTDTARPAPRATLDVDMVTQAVSLAD